MINFENENAPPPFFSERAGFKGLWSNNPPYSKLLLALGIVLMGATLFTAISTTLAALIYGVNLQEIQSLLNDYDNPLAISILKFIQTLSTIGTFILPAFVIGWLFSENTTQYLKLSKRASIISLILAFVLLVVALPLINYIGELNSKMSLPTWFAGLEGWMKESEDNAAKITEKFLEINSVAGFVFAIVMIAALPALGEELIFRGVLQRIFSEWSRNVHVGIWSSAVLFSAMHLQFYGFIPRMLLGVMLGYLLLWSGTLWLPIIAHFLNNTAAVIFAYLFNHKIIEMDADKIGTESDAAAVWISLAMTATFLWMIYNNEKKRRMIAVNNESVRIGE